MADLGRFSRSVWKGDKSPYLIKRTGREKYDGEGFRVPVTDVTSLGAADALLLHCAVVARARGKSGFVFSWTRNLNSAIVRFGERGDKGFPPEAFFSAAEVIAALSTEMPDPSAR